MNEVIKSLGVLLMGVLVGMPVGGKLREKELSDLPVTAVVTVNGLHAAEAVDEGGPDRPPTPLYDLCYNFTAPEPTRIDLLDCTLQGVSECIVPIYEDTADSEDTIHALRESLHRAREQLGIAPPRGADPDSHPSLQEDSHASGQ